MDGPVLTGLDWAVLAIVALSALLAFIRGFLREVLSVAAWLGAAVVAVVALPWTSPLAREYIDTLWLADAVAAVAVFILAVITFSLLTHMLSSGVRNSPLSAIDRSLGFAFGAARGALLACIGYLMLTFVYTEPPLWMAQARTGPLLARGAEAIRGLIPDTTQSSAERQVEAAKRQAEDLRRAKETLDRLANPQPVTAGGRDAGTAGYDKAAQNRLDQLITTTQGAPGTPSPAAGSAPAQASPAPPPR